MSLKVACMGTYTKYVGRVAEGRSYISCGHVPLQTGQERQVTIIVYTIGLAGRAQRARSARDERSE